MREKLTDELMEHFAQEYKKYVDEVEAFDDELVFTFEQFVERGLNFRQFRARKALEKIEKQKKKK